MENELEPKIQLMTEQFDEDALNQSEDDFSGEQVDQLAFITSSYDVDGSEDSSIDEGADDDFYDMGEFYDEDDGSGGDSGF